MHRNSVTYTYGYPYTWGSSNYALSYYPYANPSPADTSNVSPRAQTKTQKTNKKDKSSWLLIAVIILAILLFIAILGLITLGVLYQKCDSNSDGPITTEIGTNTAAVTTTTTTTTTTVPPTVIGFNVTRTDLNYSADMANIGSTLFTVTNLVFCEMITKNWLDGKYSSDICQCVKFEAGSVIATVHLTFDHTMGAPNDLLTSLRSSIPTKSDAEASTNKVEAADIVIVQ